MIEIKKIENDLFETFKNKINDNLIKITKYKPLLCKFINGELVSVGYIAPFVSTLDRKHLEISLETLPEYRNKFINKEKSLLINLFKYLEKEYSHEYWGVVLCVRNPRISDKYLKRLGFSHIPELKQKKGNYKYEKKFNT